MLTPEEVAHYQREGYVTLRGFIAPEEIEMLREAVERMVAGAPTGRGAECDMQGQVVEHPEDFAFTVREDGSHTLNRISTPLARSEAMLIAYGNPKLLHAVADLYGPDFVPFSESIVIKLPDHGAPFDWHQDGSFKTGWTPERGVNFGIYLHTSDENNGCVYAIPRTHTAGRADLGAMIAEHGERLPGSVPVPAAPGDVIVHSRNLIHGSFANTSPAMRVTVYFGYHHIDTIRSVYPPDHIARRVAVISEAIQNRRNDPRFTNEAPYVYHPPEGYETVAEGADIIRAPALAI